MQLVYNFPQYELTEFLMWEDKYGPTKVDKGGGQAAGCCSVS